MICFVFTNVGGHLGYTLSCQVKCFSTKYTVLTDYSQPCPATGAHFAPIPGGLIGQYLGWQWIFKFAAITNGFCLLFTFFFLPETLYIRDQTVGAVENLRSSSKNFLSRYLARMNMGKRFPGRRLRLSDFFWPYIKMIRYVRLSLFDGVILL